MSEQQKLSKPSFCKSLLGGVILEDLIFPYPEMEPEEKENLDLILATMRKFAGEYVDSGAMDREENIPEDVINGWKELGFFGLIIPETYGGYGLSTTAYIRILEEIGYFDGSTALLIGAHQSIGLKGLLLAGTEEQKTKYLPRLATGELIGAYGLTEPEAGSDAGGIKTRAVKDKDRGVYILNGSKMWITNGGIADFFTIFAKESLEMPDGSVQDKITAFIVTRDMGVISGKEEKKLGIRGSSTTALFFENVEVPEENVIGQNGRGFKLAMEILNSGRVGLAAGAIGASKKALSEIINHVQSRHQFGQPLIEFELIKKKISQISVNIFAAECMIYLTSGLIDQGDADYSLESAISKVFATDKLWDNINEVIQMAGGIGYSQDYPYEQYLRDARINTIFEGTNEILRVFIALAGMQEHGEYLKSIGKALKDPVKSFGLITDYAAHYMRGRLTTERIRGVHESIAEDKRKFETWVKNLHISVERVLIKYGRHIVEKQLIQERIADAAIYLYGMIACISRVELNIRRTGPDQNREQIRLCNLFCEQAWRIARRNILMIDNNTDDLMIEIADSVREKGQYIV